MKRHNCGRSLTPGRGAAPLRQRGRLSAARIGSEQINPTGLLSCLTWFKAQQMLEQQTVQGHRQGMGESDVRERASRSRRAGGPAFDLYASKLHRPPIRPGSIRRSSLIKQLVDGDPGPIVSVVAPSGYGKTTLLSQWAEASGQAFAWVSVDQGDNDPKVLLTYIAAALDAVEPIDGGVFEALASPASSVPGSVVPRLASALWTIPSPVVLVLDDVHLLDNRECLAALSALADHVPAG